MDKAELEFDWQLNSSEAKAEANSVEQALNEVGDAGDNAEKRVQAAIQKTNNVRREQIGIIERLKNKLAEAKDEQEKAMSTRSIERANQKIVEFQKEIDRLNKIGKQGFDDMGRAIPDFERPKGQLARMEEAAKLYKKAISEATSPEMLAKYNSKLEQAEITLKRMRSAGRSGFDLQGNAEKPTSLLGRLQYAESGYKDMIAGSSNIDIITKYNQKLQEVQSEIKRVKNVGKDGFDGLGNAIEGVVEKASEAPGGLTKIWTGMKNIASVLPGIGIASLLAFAIEPMAAYIAEMRIFQSELDRLPPAQKAVAEAMREASSQTAIQVAETSLLVSHINDNNLSTLKREELLNNFINQSPEVLGALTLQNIETSKGKAIIDSYIGSLRKKIELQQLEQSYAESVQRENDLRSGRLSEETDFKWYNSAARMVGDALTFRRSYEETIKDIDGINAAKRKEMAIEQTAITKGLENEIKLIIEGNKTKKQIEDNSITAREKQLAAVNQRLANLQKGESGRALMEQKRSLQKEIDERKRMLGLDVPKQRGKSDDTQLRQQQALQQKITDLNNEYKRKSLTEDEAEIKAVRDKFAKIAKEVEQFNKNPKNKYKVDGSGLTNTMSNAIDDLKYRQDTEALKINLDKQKVLYQQFEQYKLTFGEEKAKERFQNELDVNSTFLAKLQSTYAVAYAQVVASGGKGNANERLSYVSGALNGQENEEKQRFDKELNDAMGYEEKRKVLIANYQSLRKKMLEQGAINEASVLEKIHQESLGKLDDENTQKLSSFKNLFNGIEELSDKAATKVIADAQLMLNKLVESGAISNDLAKQIAEKLKDSQRSLEDRLPKRLQTLGSELKNIAGLVENVAFAEWINATGDVLGNLGAMKAQINSISKDWGKMSSLDKLGAGAGLFGAGMSIVGTVNSLFNKSEQKRQEQAAYATDIQLRQYEAMNKALERQISLIGKLYDTDKVTAYSDAQKKAAENQAVFLQQLEGRTLLTGDQTIDKYITANNTGYRFGNAQDRSVASGIKDKYGAYDFSKASIEELQDLLTRGKLDDATAKIVQNLIDAKNAAGDLGDALKIDLTGTNFDELRDGIIEAVTSGADMAAENANDIFRKSLLKFLADDPVLKKRIAQWYEDFAKASEDGLTSAELDKLRQEYIDINKTAEQKRKELENLSGIGLTDPTAPNQNTKNTIKGEWGSVTEQTSSVIAGRMAGIQLTVVDMIALKKQSDAQQLAELKDHTFHLMQISANTLRTANNTEDLKYMRVALESMDKKMNNTNNAIKALGG